MKYSCLRPLAAVFAVFSLIGCSRNDFVGTRCEALDDSAWNCSEWISAENAPVVSGRVSNNGNHRAADGASWFLNTVTNPGKVVSAQWMTSGLGVYDLFLNGRRVGNDFLKPGFTHPAKTRRSFTYDITDAFRKGSGAQNTLSAQVTPGWWADFIVSRNNQEGTTGRKCAFRGVLELVLADGDTLLLGTDSLSWKAGIAGSVLHAGIYDGESFDARRRPGYETPELLGTPEINREFHGEILPSDGGEICLREDLSLKPVEAYVWKGVRDSSENCHGTVIRQRSYRDGETMVLNEGETLVVDFGQNASAVPFFDFKAAEGTHLCCLPGEILNDGNGAESRGMDGPEGSVHRRNLRLQDDCFRVDYIFGGEKGYRRYLPRCSFFGYRYISVTADAPVKIRRVRSLPVTSLTAALETGRIRTGDPAVNQLLSNILWGQRSNYLSVPTDCPQRNERLGWMADTQVFTETGTFFADTRSFFRKWMKDVRDTQKDEGAFASVCPPGPFGRTPLRFGWSDAGIIVPWTVWRQFGDTTIVSENWEAMERFMDHIGPSRYAHEAHLSENGNYQYADWLSFEPLESSGRGAFYPEDKHKPLPDAIQYWNYLSGCYLAMDADMMRDMAAATGRNAEKYAAMASDAREYLRNSFFNTDGTFRTEILNTMQTPALFALKLQLVDGAAKEAVIARLRENFAAHGGCLQTGFLGTSILMQTLSENGMTDLAYDLLFKRKNPSWLYSVDNGATTIWERWNSYTYEFGMGPRGMNSFNHYAYGCVGAWIWTTAAGISTDPAAPGFRHIILRPIPDKRLGSLDAEYPSASGTIRSSWRYDGDRCRWRFTIPSGTTATVFLPSESEGREYESGSYELELK